MKIITILAVHYLLVLIFEKLHPESPEWLIIMLVKTHKGLYHVLGTKE